MKDYLYKMTLCDLYFCLEKKKENLINQLKRIDRDQISFLFSDEKNDILKKIKIIEIKILIIIKIKFFRQEELNEETQNRRNSI